MTHTTTDTTNADLRKLVAAQTEAIREIAAERDALREHRDKWSDFAWDCCTKISRLESDLRTWRVLFAIVLGAFVWMVFAFMGVVCR